VTHAVAAPAQNAGAAIHDVAQNVAAPPNAVAVHDAEEALIEGSQIAAAMPGAPGHLHVTVDPHVPGEPVDCDPPQGDQRVAHRAAEQDWPGCCRHQTKPAVLSLPCQESCDHRLRGQRDDHQAAGAGQDALLLPDCYSNRPDFA